MLITLTQEHRTTHPATQRATSLQGEQEASALTFKENLSHANTQTERERDIRGKKNSKTQTSKTKREQPLLSTCLLVMRKTKAQQGSPHLIGFYNAPTTSHAHTHHVPMSEPHTILVLLKVNSKH